jgi:hypothetical protein
MQHSIVIHVSFAEEPGQVGLEAPRLQESKHGGMESGLMH